MQAICEIATLLGNRRGPDRDQMGTRRESYDRNRPPAASNWHQEHKSGQAVHGRAWHNPRFVSRLKFRVPPDSLYDQGSNPL